MRLRAEINMTNLGSCLRIIPTERLLTRLNRVDYVNTYPVFDESVLKDFVVLADGFEKNDRWCPKIFSLTLTTWIDQEIYTFFGVVQGVEPALDITLNTCKLRPLRIVQGTVLVQNVAYLNSLFKV